MSTGFPRFIHMFSTATLRAVVAGCVLSTAALASAQSASSRATLFRVFLNDGSTLVSYGEYARVADQVVLSMPLGGTPDAPTLQLLSIPASTVNWEQTDAYAEAARAARYAETRGPNDYALLTDAVSRALSDIAVTSDADRKVAMALEARRNVTRWAAEHYAYRATDVAKLAGMFDDVISEVREAAGGRNFDLTLIANLAAPPSVPLMSAPDFHETAESAFHAAQLTEDPAERTTLLRSIAQSLAARNDAEWIAPLRTRVASALAIEEKIDKNYGEFTRGFIDAADRFARAANVRGLQALQQRALVVDRRLGAARPRELASLLASLDARLDAARRLQLARDQWAARLEVLQEYERAMAQPAAMLRASRGRLEAIRQLESTPRQMLVWLAGQTANVSRLLSDITPPPGGEKAHGLLTGAAQLAARAVTSRQLAVSTGEMQPAWEASSAASGALMLLDRASEELQRLKRVPELQ
jgi:hypothetical protein